MSRLKLAASFFALVAIFEIQPCFAQSDTRDAYDSRLSAEEARFIDRSPTIDQVNRRLELGFDEGERGNYYAAYLMFVEGVPALDRLGMRDSDLAETARYYEGAAILVWCTNNWNDCSRYNRLLNQAILARTLKSSTPPDIDDLERSRINAEFSDADFVHNGLLHLTSAWQHRTQITSVRASAIQRDCIKAEQLYLKVRPSDARAIQIIEDGSPPTISMCQT
jgi:hypothetical protein